MTNEEYVIAWACYLLGATLVYRVYCYFTRWIPYFELRYLLRLPLVAILFVPAYADPEQFYLAPAIVVALFDLTNHELGLGVRGVKLILWVMGFLFLLFFVESSVRRTIAAKRLGLNRHS
jgi:hypothetical protein